MSISSPNSSMSLEGPIGPAASQSPSSKKKRRHEEVEPAKAAANKTSLYVCTAKCIADNVTREYATGRIECSGNEAHITLKASSGTSPKMQRLVMSSGEFLKNSAALQESQSCSLWGRHRLDGTKRVTSVVLDIELILPPKESKILGGIRRACLHCFPNLNPELSTVNLHRGCEHWRAVNLLDNP